MSNKQDFLNDSLANGFKMNSARILPDRILWSSVKGQFENLPMTPLVIDKVTIFLKEGNS